MFRVVALALVTLALVPLARAADVPTVELVLQDHKFVPAELTIPAGVRVKLVVKNQGDAAAEFEGEDFKAEKVVPANSEVSLFIGPLEAGTYHFVDEFHEATKGTLIAK